MAYGMSLFDPFRDFDRFERLMRRGFESPFARAGETVGAPAVELSDEGDHYLVKAEIPGVPEDQVEITLTGNVLGLRGEKRYEKRAPQQAQGGGEAAAKEGQEQQTELARKEGGEELSRPLFSEVYYGRFERMITLPDDIDPEKVEASCQNGVFSIGIGKKAQQRARRINVTRH